MNIDYPYRFDERGRTREANAAQHIRNLIEQVLFTAPGERVNRPTFGSGLRELLFEPNSTELAATTQYLAQGALQEWLGDLIQVDEVTVEALDSQLIVSVSYTVRQTNQSEVAEFVG